MENIFEHEQVKIWKDGHVWHLRAETENWANDTYWFEGESKEDVIKQAKRNIYKDPKDRWLLNNPLLK